MILLKRKSSAVFSAFVLTVAGISFSSAADENREEAVLADTAVCLKWQQSGEGWQLADAGVFSGGDKLLSLGRPSGRYTILYSATAPDKTPVALELRGKPYPEKTYTPPHRHIKKSVTPASMNLVGDEYSFFPSDAKRNAEGDWVFEHETEVAAVSARWRLDPSFPGDVRVSIVLTAIKDGWFSIASPTLATLREKDLRWAEIPGYFRGNKINPDTVLSMLYRLGLPGRPVIVPDSSASTLASIITNQSGATQSVIADPGIVDHYPKDRRARWTWQVGLSLMNRGAEFTPTLYHPLLGAEGSQLKAGEKLVFSFRYTLTDKDWFSVIRHAAYDIYRLNDFLEMKKPVRSLSQRLRSLHEFVTTDATAMWHTAEFEGYTIGAHAYLGGVVGAKRDRNDPNDFDAMKNSDYGAMWMLAHMTGDPRLTKDRLPYARNFKFVQQQAEPGFFQGAVIGQYYLTKSKRFTEEWGGYVEPIAVTYYTMLDLGNILLYQPDDTDLRERLRLGAECLVRWQRPNGSWAVAYDHGSQKEIFTELEDVRPTFYGLLVAYKILGDKKYLDAARQGADWLIENAVKPVRFLGVCGDERFAPDFATVQTSQAYLDLYDITGEERYREAAIETARRYVTDVFTHPLPSIRKKFVGDRQIEDWQISQMGLAFEHGGLIGTAGDNGPILLSSYAGLFIRMAEITGEPLFRDLARAGTLARDAFLNPQTQAASYYWKELDKGPGRWPNHAWWQIGWIVDYLVSEVQLRSAGAISFPRGFVTPKVGPHACFGFAPGKLYGTPVNLAWGDVDTGMPDVDYLVARGTDGKRTFVILINNSPRMVKTAVKVPPSSSIPGVNAKAWKSAGILGASGEFSKLPVADKSWDVEIPAYGLSVITME